VLLLTSESLCQKRQQQELLINHLSPNKTGNIETNKDAWISSKQSQTQLSWSIAMAAASGKKPVNTKNSFQKQ
jgi:hypothetical protein